MPSPFLRATVGPIKLCPPAHLGGADGLSRRALLMDGTGIMSPTEFVMAGHASEPVAHSYQHACIQKTALDARHEL